MLEKPGVMREIFDGFLCYRQAIPAPLPSCWPQTGIQSGHDAVCSGIFGDDSAGNVAGMLLSVTTLLPQALKSHLTDLVASSRSVLSKTALTGRGIAI